MKRALLILLLLIPCISALPEPTGYVNDYANIITSEWNQNLTDLISTIEKNTTVEIAVVTVKSLEGETPERLALNYLETWGIGKKNKDNGILILVAVQERKWRIEIGYGLEGVLTDSVTGRLGRHELVPYLKEDKYGEGLYNIVSIIGKFLSGDPQVVAQAEQKFAPWRDVIGIVAFIYVFLLMFAVGFIQAINNKKIRRGITFTTAGIGFALIAITDIFWSAPFVFTFIWTSVLVIFLVVFIAIELGRPKHLKKGTHFWFGGSSGFGGGSSGGFGGFGGGGGGGGGAGGGF